MILVLKTFCNSSTFVTAMRKIKSIQIKAAFLLIAFSLNTIIGFACAVGMNMDFNSHHHEKESTISETNHHQSNDPDNCCHDKVTKIAQVDKVVSNVFSVSVNYSFLSGIFSVFYQINSLNSFKETTHIKYFVRSHHPPIPDIRVAIQSFQI